MAYRDDISALSPDHLWRFDGDVNDSEGSLNCTNTGGSTGGPAITEDASSSWQSNGTGDRLSVVSAPTVDQQLDRKLLGGWLQTTSIQLPPKSIYREGSTNNQFNLTMWAGNNVMLDVVNANGDDVQLFAERVFAPNRQYHIAARFSGSGFGDKIELFVDGVSQGSVAPGGTSIAARTAAEWSDPSGGTEAGNASVLLNGLVNGNYAYWCAWSGAGAEAVSDGQIREVLFEKGALPGVTIASDSEANMQATLNAIADTMRPDEPLNIRVEAVSGGGDLTLAADNITHNSLASIHVQYMGAGTLSWVNNNGSNGSIGSTPNGGNINFVNPAVLTIAPLIAGSQVRVYEAGTANEVAGIESSGVSFAPTVNASTVDVVVHSLEYLNIRAKSVDLSGGDLTLPISQVADRQYANP